MKYFSGVYQDNGDKILQVADDIDSLNCEILADPGVCLSKDFPTVAEMITTATTTAQFLKCSHLEVNCSRGKGSYRYIKIKQPQS